MLIKLDLDSVERENLDTVIKEAVLLFMRSPGVTVEQFLQRFYQELAEKCGVVIE